MINWYLLSKNINIQDIINHPELSWDRSGLSRNEGFNIILLKSLKLPNAIGDWDWIYLSANESMKNINGRYPWDVKTLVRRNDIVFDIVLYFEYQGFDKEDWWHISRNADINNVIKYPNKNWNLEGLSGNKGITLDIVDMELPNSYGNWDWKLLSCSIPFEQIMNNPDRNWVEEFIYRNKGIEISFLLKWKTNGIR